MSAIYVLIVVWQVGGTGGKAMESQEFTSKANCETARQTIKSIYENSSITIHAVCVPK